MYKTLLSFLAGICVSASALAHGMRPLDDDELSKVSGQDGIGIIADLRLNTGTSTDPNAVSNISVGFKGVDGNTNYLVIKNPRGALGIIGLTVNVARMPNNGADYVAVGLPNTVLFGNFGFDSLNAQSNPATAVPFDQTLGGLNINGTVNMTGQLRIWTH